MTEATQQQQQQQPHKPPSSINVNFTCTEELDMTTERALVGLSAEPLPMAQPSPPLALSPPQGQAVVQVPSAISGPQMAGWAGNLAA